MDVYNKMRKGRKGMHANRKKYTEALAAHGPQEPKISLKLMTALTKDQMYYGRLWLFLK